MATLGNKAATQHVSLQKQTITGNGGTSYSLQQSVGSALDIAVFVNNTRQEPTVAYSASGTTLTMTGAVNSSDHFYVIFLGKAIITTGLPADAVGTANINANAITAAKLQDAAVTAAKLHDDAVTHAKLPSGSVLQVSQGKFLGNETSNATDFVDITNLTVTLTPKAATSKFLVTFHVNANANSNQRGGLKVVRKIGSGSFADFDLPDFSAGSLGGAVTSQGSRKLAHAIFDGGGSNIPNTPTSMTLLDSPNTTSAVTYKVQGMVEGSSYIYINSMQTWTDANTVFAPMSTLTVMEIAG